ncbi:hypothetical protein [Caldanaerobacter subterraneus]|uniref:hypothetical protein n=1 Tax=Caldanaerobacter subterraneus TaxID=911092 RepID=UPI001A03045C|nr:hypothetical protein [Caldanaerobacter subterraneus]
MRRKIFLLSIIGVFLSLLVFAACDKNSNTEKKVYKPSITVEGNVKSEEIARTFLEKYFKHYMENTVPIEERLKDFRIDRIDIKEESPNGIYFTVSFSVKPSISNSDWMAGNGVIKENGWKRNSGLLLSKKKGILI